MNSGLRHPPSVVQRGISDPDPPSALKPGWGPARQTFTMQSPSPYVTLNSITDNPDMGDERIFLRVKPAADPDATYTDEIVGKQRYTAAIFFENSASPSLAAATNVRVSMLFPSTITGSGALSGIVKAENASPPEVWNSAVLRLPKSDDAVAIRFVPGSAVLHTEGKAGSLLDSGKHMVETRVMLCIALGSFRRKNRSYQPSAPVCNHQAPPVRSRVPTTSRITGSHCWGVTAAA